MLRSYKRPAPELRHFAYSTDGNLGLSGIFDDVLTLWDMKTGKPIRQLEPWRDLASPVSGTSVLSPGGDFAFVTSYGGYGPRGSGGGRFGVWDTKTRKRIEYHLEIVSDGMPR